MIQYFADVLADGRVRACFTYEQPEIGPPQPFWEGQLEGTLIPLNEAINWGAGGSETAVLYILNGEQQWIDSTSLNDVKTRKNEEINTCRESANANVFIFQGKAIRCRPLDRSDIDGTNGYVALFGEFPQGWAGGWKAADNSYVQITTVDEWKQFYKAMVDTGNANFRYAQQLKARLAVAETH